MRYITPSRSWRRRDQRPAEAQHRTEDYSERWSPACVNNSAATHRRSVSHTHHLQCTMGYTPGFSMATPSSVTNPSCGDAIEVGTSSSSPFTSSPSPSASPSASASMSRSAEASGALTDEGGCSLACLDTSGAVVGCAVLVAAGGGACLSASAK